MKRLLSLICVLALMATILVPVGVSAAADSKVTFTPGSASVMKGTGNAKVSIPINVSVEGTFKFTAFTLNLNYDDTKLTLSGVTDYAEDIDPNWESANDALKAGMLTLPGVPSTSPATSAFVDAAGVTIKNGTLATFEFTVPTDEVADFDLSFTFAESTDETYNDCTSRMFSGTGKISVRDELVEKDWNDITVKPITYGAKVSTAFTLPSTGKIKIENVEYTGKYTVKEDVVPNAGTTKATVVFEITQDGANKGRKFEKEFDVTVNKANYAANAITVPAVQNVEYTGNTVAFDTSAVTMPAGVTVSSVVYNPATVKNVGEYAVTLKFATTDANYNAPADKTAKIVINKATATSVVDAANLNKTFDAGSNADAAALKAAMNLPATVAVAFGNGSTEDVSVTWANATESWNAKGGTYTYKATLTSSNLNVSGLNLTATATVEAVNGTFTTDPALSDITVSKAQVLAANSLADLGIPATGKLAYANENKDVTIAWDKALSDVKAKANTVTNTKNAEITLNVADSTFDSYKFVTVSGDRDVKITITSKKTATVTLAPIADVAYGEAINVTAPTWVANDGGSDNAATIKVTYKGINNTDYPESETLPVYAGEYEAVATLVSDIYAGSATQSFKINTKALTGDIAITSDGTALSYTANLPGAVEGTDYTVEWYKDGVKFTAGASYTLTEADLGKTFKVKVIANGKGFEGTIESADFLVPAKAPSDVKVTTRTTANTIVATFTAKANGASISKFDVTITDNAAYSDAVEVNAENSKATYTFTGLETGVEYTITAKAVNSAGESEVVTVVATPKKTTTSGGSTTPIVIRPSNNSTPDTPVTPVTPVVPETSLKVDAEEGKATIPASDLKDKHNVNVSFEATDDLPEIEVEADIKDKDVAEMEVSVEVVEDGVFVVNVDAKNSAGSDVAVSVDIKVETEEQAAVIVAEDGEEIAANTEYDAENGVLEIKDVVSGSKIKLASKETEDTFDDDNGRWSEPEIEKAAQRGLVNGKAPRIFDPEGMLTRHESNKLQMNLVAALNTELDKVTTANIDTPAEHWAYASDVWAVEAGIMNGTSVLEDGTLVLSGEANITRQDFMTIIYRMMRSVLGNFEHDTAMAEFADVAEIADYATDAVAFLSALNIVKGSEDGDVVKVNPTAEITREEAAAIINRVFDVVSALK